MNKKIIRLAIGAALLQGTVIAAFALGAVAAVVLAVPDAVCARAAGAIDKNPANAVNHKALLRRITTLSRLRITEDFRASAAPKKRRDETGAPSSSAASSSDAALPPSRIFTHEDSSGRTVHDAPAVTPEVEIRHATH